MGVPVPTIIYIPQPRFVPKDHEAIDERVYVVCAAETVFTKFFKSGRTVHCSSHSQPPFHLSLSHSQLIRRRLYIFNGCLLSALVQLFQLRDRSCLFWFDIFYSQINSEWSITIPDKNMDEIMRYNLNM